jgi:ABC-type uncharacterized transport system substrate-binding protein
VFSVPEDPVRLGLVASLARPGGNATGINFFSNEVLAKRLELLRGLVPAVTRVAVLISPDKATDTDGMLREVEAATRAMGLKILVVNANTAAKSMRPSQRLYESGPTRFLSAEAPFCSVGASSWRCWRRATPSPHHTGRVSMPQSVD